MEIIKKANLLTSGEYLNSFIALVWEYSYENTVCSKITWIWLLIIHQY